MELDQSTGQANISANISLLQKYNMSVFVSW